MANGVDQYHAVVVITRANEITPVNTPAASDFRVQCLLRRVSERLR